VFFFRQEISTSPKLSSTSTRSAISPSTSTLNSNSSTTSPSRRSSERDRTYNDDNSATYDKYSSPVKTLGLNGLKNIGNTCFMNSVIQCLSNTKLLLEYLLQDYHVSDINTTTSAMKGALIKAFAEVIKKVWSQDASDRVVNTASLKSQIQRFAPRFIGYAQQDAQEFLRYLLEGLHEDVNRVKEKPKPILTEIDEKLSDSEKSAESWSRYLRVDNSKIVDYFVGQLKSTLKCTHCGHCSVTFDPFWDLSLPIPQRAGQVRLAQCLDSFTREETLDGDEKPTCSKCKERRKCTKSFTIQKFPKILVIHLKRFSLAERFRGKLSVTVDFPLEGLDMSHYAADNITPCRYNLYAISNHSGTTYSGHYTAYCRHPYTKAWHEYNDSRVSSISPKSIVSGEAYVLFYEQEGQKSHL
jgi:ubiquitin carboxyl-terminal hydrolase 2/21